MSILPYILPPLTVVSLFLFIFSSERAWLPKAGTTEWIKRASVKNTMTVDINHEFMWKDIIIFFALALVYAGLLFLSFFPEIPDFTLSIICAAVFIGVIYLIALLLFKHRSAAVFAAAMAAADMFLMKTFISEAEMLLLIAAFVFFALLSVNTPVLLIPAGVFLGGATYLDPSSALFTLFALVIAVVLWAMKKSAKYFWMYLLCCLALPVAIYCGLSYFTNGNILIVPLLTSFSAPVFFNVNYCFTALVCLIITFIHIFKDRSFTALLSSAGLVICAVGLCFGINFLPLFAGLVLAYPADIIIKRGRKLHKAFLIIFGVIMLLPVLYCSISPIISTYLPDFVLF